MANGYIREYSNLPAGNGQSIPVPNEPPHVTQTVSFTTTTQSNAFNDKTNYVMIYADAACAVEFGSNPTALTTSVPLEASKFYFFGVNKDDKVAFVTT